MVGKSGVLSDSVFLETELYIFSKLVNTVNATSKRSLPESGLQGVSRSQ